MATYRFRVTAYTVTDQMQAEFAGTVQVQDGASWSDVGETTVEIPAAEFRDCTTLADYATVVRRHAAQMGLIRKQRVLQRLEALVPQTSLPVNLSLGEL